jgi:hypothetical protein
LRNEDVNPATLQAAYAADSNATLNALQQGTDVLAQVGAVLAQRQGAPVATNVEADLTGEALLASAAQAAQPQSNDVAPPQTAAIAQRQLELQQQLEAEELNLDLQELRPQPSAQQADNTADLPQVQRTDSQRVDVQRFDSDRVNADQQAQQQETARVDELRQAQAQLAQQNAQAQELAAQAAGRAVPPPSSQDPSVAAAIAAYNLNNAALNPGLMNRPLPASDSRLPLVAPVAPVEPVKPVTKI